MSQSARVSSEPSQMMSWMRLGAKYGAGNGELRPARSCAPVSKPRVRHATSAPRRPKSWSKRLSSTMDQIPFTPTSMRPYSHVPLVSAPPSTRRTVPSFCPERQLQVQLWFHRHAKWWYHSDVVDRYGLSLKHGASTSCLFCKPQHHSHNACAHVSSIACTRILRS